MPQDVSEINLVILVDRRCLVLLIHVQAEINPGPDIDRLIELLVKDDGEPLVIDAQAPDTLCCHHALNIDPRHDPIAQSRQFNIARDALRDGVFVKDKLVKLKRIEPRAPGLHLEQAGNVDRGLV